MEVIYEIIDGKRITGLRHEITNGCYFIVEAGTNGADADNYGPEEYTKTFIRLKSGDMQWYIEKVNEDELVITTYGSQELKAIIEALKSAAAILELQDRTCYSCKRISHITPKHIEEQKDLFELPQPV